MRLAVAATFLAQAAVPTKSESRKKDTLVATGSTPWDFHRREQGTAGGGGGGHAILTGGPFSQGRNKAKTSVMASFLQKISKMQSRGALKNIPEKVVECDPTLASMLSSSSSSEDAAVADVGILACGDGSYCVGSPYSSLGGVCADDIDIHRDLWYLNYSYLVDKLEYYCSDDCDNFHTCDCNINGTEARADASFSTVNYCFEFPSLCTGDESFTTCFNESVVATVTDPENFSFEGCLSNFYPPDSNKSFSTSYCYGTLQEFFHGH
jgi:hypothetical protein